MIKFFDPKRKAQIYYTNLPHWQQDDCVVFVTWRLFNSVPQCKLDEYKLLKEEFELSHPKPWNDTIAEEFNELIGENIERWLHTCSDNVILREQSKRDVLCNVIERFDGLNYNMYGYVIMPNHVHMLMSPYVDIKRIIKGIKQVTTRDINRLNGNPSKIWQRGFFDHLVRSQNEFDYYINYIANNPNNLNEDQYTLKLFDK